MLNYITVGANDVPRSGRFYAAVLIPLGYEMTETAHGVEFTSRDPARNPSAVYVEPPYDGKPATVGNGSMAAFRADTQALVRSIHAAGLAAGGADEGAPGFRDDYSDQFHVSYLRDPLGNKIAIFCTNPAEGTRRP